MRRFGGQIAGKRLRSDGPMCPAHTATVVAAVDQTVVFQHIQILAWASVPSMVRAVATRQGTVQDRPRNGSCQSQSLP